MPATVTRADFIRSPGYVKYNGSNLFMREKFEIKHAPTWEDVMTSMFGAVDKFKKNVVIKVPLKLWGAWESLPLLFPPYIMNPIPGTSVFGLGGIDIPLYVQGTNGDYISYTNAAVTKVSDLYLGVDSDIWAADVEFTCLIGNANNPEDVGAYHVRGTNAYTDAAAAFSKANFKRVRFTAAWGAIAGFSGAKPMTPQKGIKCSWASDLQPIDIDGLGTRDMSVGPKGTIGQMKMIGIGPTLLQYQTASQEVSALGTLASTLSGDLVATGLGGSPIVTMKNAYLMENSLVFDATDLRVGEATWETTRGFVGNVPAIVSSVA